MSSPPFLVFTLCEDGHCDWGKVLHLCSVDLYFPHVWLAKKGVWVSTCTPFLANWIIGNVEQLSCALTASPIYLLQSGSGNSALFSSPFQLLTSVTYLSWTFFHDSCHLQPCRRCGLQCPWATVFNLFLEPATKWQDCFKPHSGYRAAWAFGKFLFLIGN